jgi:hypothetical protein
MMRAAMNEIAWSVAAFTFGLLLGGLPVWHRRVKFHR